MLVLGVSDFQVSLLPVLAGVVGAVAALPLGPWIEHHRKLPVMVAADLLRFAAVASVPAAALLGVLTYWQLAVVAVVQMAARMAFDAAGVAQLRTLVPREHRAEANGRFETTVWTANALGPSAGGVLISWLGATATMVLDALSFLVSAVMLRGLRTREPPPPERAAEHHWLSDLTAGWRYIFGHRGLTALFWNSMIFGGCHQCGNGDHGAGRDLADRCCLPSVARAGVRGTQVLMWARAVIIRSAMSAGHGKTADTLR